MSDPTDPRPALSRRALLAGSAGLGALALPAGTTLAADRPDAAGSERVPGIQLFTLRGAMADDPHRTLLALAGMGYGAVEFAGHHGVPPGELRGWLDELGLTAPSGHVPPHDFRDDPGPWIESAVTLGHDYLVLPWLAEEDRQTVEDYRGWARVLNRAGRAAREAGLRVAYHNHDFEFMPIDGVVPQELLMAETDPGLVDFELDFFWVRKAGRSIREVLNWAPERFTLAHIKDIDEKGDMVDVGAGTIDFAGVLASPAAAHIRHPFVEHDNPPDPFRTAAVGRFWLGRALA
jgi:sugar phosphate isomerase/epimerase